MKIVPLTVRTLLVASQTSDPLGVVQEYDVDGIMLKEPATLRFRFEISGLVGEPWSLSKVGGVPLFVTHG
jgi:hypothetical protein